MTRFAGTGAVLALVCAAEFLVVGAIAIVAIALPAMGRDLGAGPVALQWVLTAYVLCFGGLLLLGDVLGRGRMLMLGRRLPLDEHAPRRGEPVDVAGALAITGTVALAILALPQLEAAGPASPLPWAAPIVPLAALRSRTLAAANLGAFAFQAATTRRFCSASSPSRICRAGRPWRPGSRSRRSTWR